MSFIVIGTPNGSTVSVVIICPAEALNETLQVADFSYMAPLAKRLPIRVARKPVTHYAIQGTINIADAEELARRGDVSIAREIEPIEHIDAVLVGSGFRKVAPVSEVVKEGVAP